MAGRRSRQIAAALTLAAVGVAAQAGAAGSALPQTADAESSAAALKGLSSARTKRSFSLTLKRPARVTGGEILLACVNVRSVGIRHPAGWRLIRADSSRGRTPRLTQALYYRVATRFEPGRYRWHFPAKRGASGGLLAYDGIDTARAIAAHSGRFTRNSRSIPAPSVPRSVRNVLVVGCFGVSGGGSLRTPREMSGRYRIRGHGSGSSSAAADTVVGEIGAGGAKVARLRARHRSTIGQLVALRLSSGTSGPPPPPPPPAACSVTLAPGQSINTALGFAAPGTAVCLGAGTYSQAIVFGRPLTSFLTLRCLPGAVLTNPNGHTLRVNEPGAYLRVESCRFAGSGVTAGGIIDLYGSHIAIVGNEITGSRDNGIYTDEKADHASIVGNRIHDNGDLDVNQDHGIYLQGDDHLVANNLIYNHPQGFGIQNYDYGRRARIVNNTIFHNGYGRPCCGGIVVGGSGNGPEGSGVRDAVVANNIVTSNAYFSISVDSAAPASCDVHANLSFGTVIKASGWPSGCVGANAVGDPLYVGPADFHLLPGSPGIDAGDPALAVSPDLDGVTRPRGARPDLGAFERP